MEFCKPVLFCYEYSKLRIKTLFLLKSSYFLNIVSECFDNIQNPWSNNKKGIELNRNVCKGKTLFPDQV